eukprot:TRINITY_DN64377_c0_g1_i1.p1 TRINITY_DN64377_c0_g1~~TRINITY_DN64377_c0_g1_i1.p1  ORF type:complete len:217 (+),score=44.82 TRINITY_DN64377_c0_g1_i1:156-806(+)
MISGIAKTVQSCMGGQTRPHQIVMLGPAEAGKTTLLYRLKIPRWHNIIDDLQRLHDTENRLWDPGYHYEELSTGSLKKFGIWDVPGSESMMPMWPLFYRYVQVTAVIFVVDGSEAPEKLPKAKRQMYHLLNEDELRSAAFILIVNQKRGCTAQQAATAFEVLGASEIEGQSWNAPRFRKFSFDCEKITGVSDKNWRDVVEEIYKIYISVGPGRFQK